MNAWQGKKEEIDFFVAKGIVDRVAEKLDIQFEYEAGEIKTVYTQVERFT